MIKLSHINKHYGSHHVLNDFNIEIGDNEFVVMLGPSGCGKSTLLRAIAGLESVTSGEIVFDGEPVEDLPPRERNIAMVFQDYALYSHKTCYQNISFNMELDKVDKSTIRDKVTSVAGLLGIQDYLDSHPAQLSGGQRQRVGMGRALVRDPSLFLFDEPLSNLDAKLRSEMCTEIIRLHQRMKKTTIYVTHDQNEAMILADRLMIMNKGVVEQSGPPLELYDAPQNTFVADFLGSPSINFINGHIELEGNAFHLVDDQRRLFEIGAFPSKAGHEVISGIRPENIELAEPGSTGITADVELIEQLGHVSHVYVKLASHKLCATLQKRTRLSMGDQVDLRIPKNAIHLFEATGKQQAITPEA